MAALATRGRTLGELLGADAGGYGRLAITDLTLDSRQVTRRGRIRRARGARGARACLRGRGARARRGDRAVRAARSEVPAVAVPSLAVPELEGAARRARARAFTRVSPAPTLVGVTGTNGKTTVAYLLAQALGSPQRPCAYIGTLGYGVPPQLTRSCAHDARLSDAAP